MFLLPAAHFSDTQVFATSIAEEKRTAKHKPFAEFVRKKLIMLY